MRRKQVNAYGIRYRVERDGASVIVIPLCSIKGELHAIQCIYEDGAKRIYGAKKGNFHLIGSFDGQSLAYITEGYATGASIHQAVGNPIVIAIDCGNLKAVATNLREKYPEVNFIIAGDDDVETIGNPGRNKAEEAGRVIGCGATFPKFPNEFKLSNGKRPTDFNDLHVNFGIEEVVNQLSLSYNSNSQPTKDQQSKFQFLSAYSLTQQPPKENWLIKPYLDLGSLGVLFGEPGSMKSFLAIDIGCSVATGHNWHGMPVRKAGAVFYIAGEGFNGLSKRLRAWSIANNSLLEETPFFVSNSPAQLLDESSAKEVVVAIDELVTKHGKPVFVVIDTLNRNFGPGDENKTEDMSKFVACIDAAIRLKYGCTVLIVHHSPLNDPGRARGASSLRGALDWEYSLIKQGENTKKLSATKVKDYETPLEIYFKPTSILLDGWVDEEDGKIMTSCVLEKIEGNASVCKSNVEKLKDSPKIALDCLLLLFESGNCNKSEGVHIDAWRDAAYKANISSSGKAEANKKALQRAIKNLQDMGYIETNNNYWRPCGTWDRDGTFKRHVPTKAEGQTGHVSLDMSRCPDSQT